MATYGVRTRKRNNAYILEEPPDPKDAFPESFSAPILSLHLTPDAYHHHLPKIKTDLMVQAVKKIKKKNEIVIIILIGKTSSCSHDG